MKQRIISFATLWSILAISLWLFGVHAGVFIIAILAFLTQLELYQLFTKMGLKPMKGLGISAGVVITLGAYYLGDIDSGSDLFALSFVVIALIIIDPLQVPPRHTRGSSLAQRIKGIPSGKPSREPIQTTPPRD